MKRLSLVMLFVFCLLPSLGETTTFSFYPEECMRAFGMFGFSQSPSCPSTTNFPLTIFPASPQSDQSITLCTLDYIYPDHVSVTRVGNRITLTLYDNGFSWSPNPAIIIGTQIDALPTGSYLVDVVITSNWSPVPLWYPKTIETNLAFEVSDFIPGSCAANLSCDLALHIPIINCNDTYLQGDMACNPTGDGTLLCRVVNYELSDPAGFGNCESSTLTSDLKLHVPAGIYNNISYQADFEYVPTTDGQLWFKLVAAIKN